MKKITVTLEVKPVSVELEVPESLSKQEIVELAKKEYLAQINKKFPSVNCRISEGSTLTFDNVFIGKVVKDNDSGLYGVVTKINTKSMNVSFKHTILRGHPSLFAPAEEDINFDEILWQRSESMKNVGIWSEGNVGYLVIPQDKVVTPVVVAKVTGAGNYQLFPLNENTNRYWRLNEQQIKRFVFDSKEEAEKSIK